MVLSGRTHSETVESGREYCRGRHIDGSTWNVHRGFPGAREGYSGGSRSPEGVARKGLLRGRPVRVRVLGGPIRESLPRED